MSLNSLLLLQNTYKVCNWIWLKFRMCSSVEAHYVKSTWVEYTGMKLRSLYYRINNDMIVIIVNSNSLWPIYHMGPEIHLDYEDSCLIQQGIQTVSLFTSQATEDTRPSHLDKNLLLVLMLNLVQLFRTDTRSAETRTRSKIQRYVLFYGCLF